MDFKDRVVILTGASRGIGLAIAKAFGAQGARLALVARNPETLEAAAEAVRAAGGEAKPFPGDVSEPGFADGVVKDVTAEWGGVDVLVNNAGITRDGLLMRMKDEDWDDVLRINLTGAFRFTRAVARPMMKAKGGSILNVASVVGLSGNAGQANYAAAKAGLIAFTKSVAAELGSRGIRVNAIAPGYIDTDMTAEIPEAAREAILSETFLGRLGSAEDITGAVLYLASDRAGFVTGHTLVVDGGLSV